MPPTSPIAAPRWRCSTRSFDGERLLAEATRLRDDATRAPMAAAAAALGLPHAAETIAAELLAMGEGRPLPSLAGGAA